MRPDGTNPCRHIETYTGSKRTRLITDEELTRLYAYLVMDTPSRRSGRAPNGEQNAIRLRPDFLTVNIASVPWTHAVAADAIVSGKGGQWTPLHLSMRLRRWLSVKHVNGTVMSTTPAVTLPDDGPTGGFFRDGKALPW